MASKDLALLLEAALLVLLLLGASVAFPLPPGASGCPRASPLTFTGSCDGSLPTTVLLEAAEAFVGLAVPREVLGINTRASPCLRVCP